MLLFTSFEFNKYYFNMSYDINTSSVSSTLFNL